MTTGTQPGLFHSLRHVPDAVIISDETDRVLFWNRGAEVLYRIPAGEALERPIENLFELTEISLTHQEIRMLVREKGSWQGEVRQHTQDDIYVEVDWTVARCAVGEHQDRKSVV